MSDKLCPSGMFCVDVDSFRQLPVWDDLGSSLIRRIAKGMEAGASKEDLILVCLTEGQSLEHAELIYIAAQQLSASRLP